jgi:predicted nucleic acid-binding protein
VVDASVAVKWVLPLADEQHRAHADRLLDDYAAGRVYLIGPAQLSSEVGSALLKAVRTERITAEQGRAMVEAFRRLLILEIPGEAASEAAWDLAIRFGCSYHDARYLALAELLHYPFVHADEKLRAKLAGTFRHEVWIEDYRTPPA